MPRLNFLPQPETRHLLHQAWLRVPERYRGNNQFLGRQYAGCAATIGVMPRCDFACKACYLGKDANRIPMASLEDIKRQLDLIRGWLGHGGNVQITDGEVTLRDTEELLEIVCYAVSIKLVPMLMTHGDQIRQDPLLLPRLMQEAGLREISIHIDTTQRGRMGAAFRYAKNEQALMPLRDEFAQLIRQVRKQTRKPLKVAMTVTVTTQNAGEVADIVRWANQNADVVTLLSFQPVADVGRTVDGAGSAGSVEALWAQIAQGLHHSLRTGEDLVSHSGHLGHEACTRFVQGLVVHKQGSTAQFQPLFLDGAQDWVFLQDFLARFGGISTRFDTGRELFMRVFVLCILNPAFVWASALPFVWRKWRELCSTYGAGLWRDVLLRRTRIHYLNIVSHHFMSLAEINTGLGQERIDSCAFKVPIDGEMMSMCLVNAAGHRERYYEALREAGAIAVTSAPVSSNGKP